MQPHAYQPIAKVDAFIADYTGAHSRKVGGSGAASAPTVRVATPSGFGAAS